MLCPGLQIVQYKATVMLFMDEGNGILSLQAWSIAAYTVY